MEPGTWQVVVGEPTCPLPVQALPVLLPPGDGVYFPTPSPMLCIGQWNAVEMILGLEPGLHRPCGSACAREGPGKPRAHGAETPHTQDELAQLSCLRPHTDKSPARTTRSDSQLTREPCRPVKEPSRDKKDHPAEGCLRSSVS